MRPTRTISLLLLALPLWTTGCGNQITAAAPPATRWEYKVVPLIEFYGTSDPFALMAEAFEDAPEGAEMSLLSMPGEMSRTLAQRVEQGLNELAQQGWQLVEQPLPEDLHSLLLRRPVAE